MAYRKYEIKEVSIQWDFDRDGPGPLGTPARLGSFLPANSVVLGSGTILVSQTINGPGPARWRLRTVESPMNLTPSFNPPNTGTFSIIRASVPLQSEIAFISTVGAVTSGKLTAIIPYYVVETVDL